MKLEVDAACPAVTISSTMDWGTGRSVNLRIERWLFKILMVWFMILCAYLGVGVTPDNAVHFSYGRGWRDSDP